MKLAKSNPEKSAVLVDSVLNVCREELERARQQSNFILERDLGIALTALELIYSELHGSLPRPKEKRMAIFIRYVIDEESQMVMDAELRDVIERIEDVYSRY